MTLVEKSKKLTREVSLKTYIFADGVDSGAGSDYRQEGYMRFTLPKNIASVLSLRMVLVIYIGSDEFTIEKVGITDNNSDPLSGNLNQYVGGPFGKDANDYIQIGPIELRNLLFDLKNSANYIYYKFNEDPPAVASTPRLDLWKLDLVYTTDRGIKP